MATAADANKRVLVLGANGVGKSYILNRLLQKENQYFPSGTGGSLVTKEMKEGVSEFKIESGNLNLTAIDTPGNFFFKKILVLAKFYAHCDRSFTATLKI
jgi:GTPase SAR1 family protein